MKIESFLKKIFDLIFLVLCCLQGKPNFKSFKSELEMIIRKETVADIEAITEVTIAAFKNHPISKHTEQFIIKALRDAGALTVSLVA